MPYLCIDIETAENETAKELIASTKYRAASNLRDPAKIEQSILEKRQKDMESCALHWWTGKVICICVNPVGLDAIPMTFSGDNEIELLRQFLDWSSDLHADQPFQLIGKSADLFDIPFLVGRILRHDLGLPRFLKPNQIRDIDHIFSYSSACEQRSSLRNYAFGIGLKPKTMTGADVAGLYDRIKMGETDLWLSIQSYCANDVDIVSAILQRYETPYISRTAPKPVAEETELPFAT